LVPSEGLGPFGDACIEVHHHAVAVAKMDGKARTRLADLQCLCANCHRIVHREQL
jgi:5-methylcytosine-specific restriction protein A